MGNTNNRDQWAARERLAFVERVAWWRGVVNRGDLREVFGISAAQSSADLQAYQELNPGALAYNLSSKRYEAQPAMSCRLHQPKLEEAVGFFLGETAPAPRLSQTEGARVDIFAPPMRRASAEVERRIFLALDQRRRLGVKYWSVKSGRGSSREIAPHALGHDGYRWHVRAWCFVNDDFRDFVMSRIESAEWPGGSFMPERLDVAWETFEIIRLRANPKLGEEQRKSIERDYGMHGGKLEIKVRSAMKEYCLAHLRIPTLDAKGRPRPQHLTLAE